MLTLVLYPVYQLARAAFLSQSGSVVLAARAMGSSPFKAFVQVSLPMARPAIAAGVLLATMETIADFGTVSYFGVQTFATGIYTSWFSMADRTAAAQLALGLLAFALLLALLERSSGRARYANGRRQEPMPPAPLVGWQRWAATSLCAFPVLFAVIIPGIALWLMALGSEQDLLSRRYIHFIENSLTLASIGAVVTMVAAVVLGSVARLRPGRLTSGTLYAGRLLRCPGASCCRPAGALAALDNTIDVVRLSISGQACCSPARSGC